MLDRYRFHSDAFHDIIKCMMAVTVLCPLLLIYFDRVFTVLGREPHEFLLEEIIYVLLRSLVIMLVFGFLMQTHLCFLRYLVRKEIDWKQRQINAMREPKTREEWMQELIRGDVKVVELDG